MQTNFDHITDAAIAAVDAKPADAYPQHAPDVVRIGYLASLMAYWRCWFGQPVTHYAFAGLDYDGHHRLRAVKYLATLGITIQVPMRYDARLAVG